MLEEHVIDQLRLFNFDFPAGVLRAHQSLFVKGLKYWVDQT